MSHAHLSVTTPLPGTELWELCKGRGLVSEHMDWSRLDFGNPANPDLIYVNAHMVPREKFNQLLKEAKKSCEIWNPRLTVRDYLFLFETFSLKKFTGEAVKKILSIPMSLLKKLRGC